MKSDEIKENSKMKWRRWHCVAFLQKPNLWVHNWNQLLRFMTESWLTTEVLAIGTVCTTNWCKEDNNDVNAWKGWKWWVIIKENYYYITWYTRCLTGKVNQQRKVPDYQTQWVQVMNNQNKLVSDEIWEFSIPSAYLYRKSYTMYKCM